MATIAPRTVTERLLGPAGPTRPINIAMAALMIPLPIFWIDHLFTRTALITPINHSVLKGFVIAGAGMGILLACLTMMLTLYPRPGMRAPGYPRRVAIVLFFSLGLAPLYALLFYHATWRLTELYDFSWQAPAWTPTRYRVLKFHENSRNRDLHYAEIDPYYTDDNTWIPITASDYRRLRASYVRDYASPYCINVLEERSGKAVRVLTTPAREGAPSALTWCPGRVAGDPA